ncbi:hypothetical protein MAR_021197 [Mya arenaria]|uniref:BEN domain-containing protein n=1 Tax=Mya arenaria TaxID=6604 RepID=A0ABY7EAS3_MYAAR|nr:uncharacterized protein LOC128234072 [Mya arenaria]WAR05828.1 hypothetical protein MAR_021197 [Mya arenaria]
MQVINEYPAQPSTSTSSYAGTYSCQCESQLSQIWSWLGTLEQRTAWLMQRSYPGRVFNKLDRSSLNSPSIGNSTTTTSFVTQQEEQPSSVDTMDNSSTASQLTLYGSYTKAQLVARINGVGDYSKAAKLLFRLLYQEEEYRGRTLGGGRPNVKYDRRPVLEDLTKMDIIYEIITEKYSMSSAAVDDKIREILKPSRVFKKIRLKTSD